MNEDQVSFVAKLRKDGAAAHWDFAPCGPGTAAACAAIPGPFGGRERFPGGPADLQHLMQHAGAFDRKRPREGELRDVSGGAVVIAGIGVLSVILAVNKLKVIR